MIDVIGVALWAGSPSTFESLGKLVQEHPVTAIVITVMVLGIVANIIEEVKKRTPATGAKVVAGYVVVCLGAFAVARAAGEYLYFIAFLLGMATALAEIIGKFKDAPWKALRTSQAVWYLAFNGTVSAFAVYVLTLSGWKSVEPLERLKLVVAGGLGAMVVMRSKLFSGKVGDQDISFGPEQIVKVYLDFMERDIDRIRAQSRIDFVRETMEPLKFEEVKEYTLTMLDSAQTLSAEKRTEIKNGVGTIASSMDIAKPENKAFSLGFLLSKEMGEDFVRKLFEKPRPEWLSRAVIAERPTGLVARWLPDDSIYYFAFGSSMSSAVMRSRLGWKGDGDKFLQLTSPRAAKLKGFKLTYSLVTPNNGSPEAQANIVEDAQASVEGVVYRLSAQTLDFLDYNQSASTRRSVKVLVTDEKGKEIGVDAQAYVSASVGESGRPTREYLRKMLEGAREHNLPQEYVSSLERMTGTLERAEDAMSAKAS